MATATAPFSLTATQMREQLAAGSLTAAAIVDSLAEALPDLDEQTQAWTHLDLASARRAAERIDADGHDGLLAGVPFAAKDNIDTHDMPTAYGTPIYAGATPSRDASCVAGLRMAGALLVGKTVSTEFAHRHPGKTTNPWNPAHTPGGSSSGSAAAVAKGMVPIAFGTQTTGSVIRPAAYCGVIGYKPSFGDFNVCGVLPNTPGFDTIGTMTRSIEDVVLVRRALLDPSIRDLHPIAIRAMRVGICRSPYWDEAEEEAKNALLDWANELERRGAEVSDFTSTAAFDGLAEANLMVSGYEFARTLAFERAHHLDNLSAVLRDGRMADGLTATHADYVKGLQRLERLRLAMDEAVDDYDVLITLPAPGPAPAGLGATGPATFNMPWTTLHTPAITLPVGKAQNGLPIGIQLVAKRHRDAELLDCAATVLEVLGHWR